MILDELNAKIAPLIDNEMDLEAEIIEAEDTRMKIIEGITCLKNELNSCPVPRNLDSAPSFTARDSPYSQSEITVSSTSTSRTVSSSPHKSVDAQLTLAAAIYGPVYTEADITPITEHTAVVSSSNYTTNCLPKLSIPTFTGDLLTWQSFWDCFDSTVNSTQCFVMSKTKLPKSSATRGCL